MTSLPPPVQSVLELFQGPLASVRFADIDAAGLAKLAAEVEAASSEVREQEDKLSELRQALAQRQEALLTLAQQALAYARVYAENDEPLLEAISRIALPRAGKPRKAAAPAKGNGARDATAEGGSGAAASDNEGGALGEVEPEQEASEEALADPVSSEAEPLVSPPGRAARSARKGRGAAQRATN